MKTYSALAASLLVVLAAIALLTVNFKTDISDFFFQGDSPETALVAGKMQSGMLSRQYLLLLEPKNTEADIESFVQDLQDMLFEVPQVKHVWKNANGASPSEQVGAYYAPFAVALHSLNPEVDVPLLFSSDALRARAKNIKQALLSQQFIGLQPLLHQDPMLLLMDWFNQLPKATVPDEKRGFVGLTLETNVSGLDSAAQHVIYDGIRQSFAKVNAIHHEQFVLRLTGVPLFAMQIKQQVSEDVTMVSFISISLMALLFLITFRSLRGLLWVSFVLLGSVAMASIVTSLFFGYLHGLTIAIGSTLIGVCVDYPIHIMVHAASANPQESVRTSVRRIWPSLLLGGLTTVVGYIALSFAQHPGMQQLALFAGVGIATALLISRYVLPGMMQGYIEQVNVGINLHVWLQAIKQYGLFFRVIILLGCFIWSFWALPHLQWSDDLSKLSPSLTNLRDEDKAIRKQLNSIESGRFILIEGESLEQALRLNEHVFQKLSALKKKGDVQSFYSIYPWFASEELQHRNLKAFSQAKTENHTTAWQKALEAEGLSVEMLGNLSQYNNSSITFDAFKSSPVQNILENMYVKNKRGVILINWLGMHDALSVQHTLQNMQGVRYISQKEIVNKLSEDYRKQTVKMLQFGLLAIGLLLFLRFKSLWVAVRLLAPALVATLLVASAWSSLEVPMGMLHLIGLLLVVAICVDYAIFIYENRAEDIRRTFQAILVSALTTIAAFASLGFADNPALQAMAWTVAPGVLLGFMLCPLLLQPKVFETEGDV